MLNKIRELAEKQGPGMTELRHHFHSNPELSWQEVETTRKIVEIIENLGFENIRTGFGELKAVLLPTLTWKRKVPCLP